MATVRQAAVAGRFYPDDPRNLRDLVDELLAAAGSGDDPGPPPKALIAPHAGFVYSGTVAASAYAGLASARSTIGRVVMLGPAHRVPVRGLAASPASAFATPLGPVSIDRAAIEQVAELDQVEVAEEAHLFEHCLEVQLPFLQQVLESFSLIPLLVGEATPSAVAEVLERLWGGEETLILISTDLSHFHDYETARRIDANTSDAILALTGTHLGLEMACGARAIRGLLTQARRHGLAARQVDLRNSGDTTGPKDQVVGYGSYAFA